MQRHSTLDGRQPESRIRHSSLVTRHSPLCIVLAALLAASASAASLPAGYTQYAYIESTGTQYIDTGVVPTTTTRVVSDFRLTAMPSAPIRNGWASASSKEAFWFGIDNDHVVFSAAVSGNSLRADTDVPVDMFRHTFDISMGGVFFDGRDIPNPGSPFTNAGSGKTMYLFASRQGWTPNLEKFAKMELYSCQVYSGDTLVRDFVPCTDENGKPGLYDTVDEQMHYNLASGADFLFGMEEAPLWTLSVAQTNGVWYATTEMLKGAGDIDLLVVSPQGTTNVVALSNGSATAPATFTTAIPDLSADTIYTVAARASNGGSAFVSKSVTLFNGAVTVAVTPNATSATPGAFTVSRASTADATWLPLTVNFTLSGTAAAGTHYAPIPATVTIPAGAASATVEVRTLSKETASTSLTLTLSDGDYFIGDPSSATMSITTVFAEKIVRVAPGGTGDGSSWASPMGSVADAYASAAAFVEGGGASAEVWVRTGRYTISSAITVKSGVSVLGGFLGTETDASQACRDNLTIISGDNGDNDYWMPCGTNTAEKLYVWTGDGKTTFNPPAPRDPDEYWVLSNGGANNYGYGFQALAANPPVTNCTFAGLTFTSFRYCPLYMLDGGPHVGVAVTNCNFWACSDSGYGALLVTAAETRIADNLCWGGRARIRVKTPASVACTNEIVNCVLRDGYSNGGLYLECGTTYNTWRVKGCGFIRNRSDSNGYAPAVHISGNKSATRLEMTDSYIRECILNGSCYGLVQTDDGGMSHTLLFKDCDFEGNVRTNSTSGTACFTGCKIGKNWFFDGCSFRGNRMWYAGSGCTASVYYAAGANQYATFLNCSFEGNSVQVVSGSPAKMAGTIGLFSEHTRASLVNSLLDGNAFVGAATNAEIVTSTSYNMLLAVVNSVLHGDGQGYAPLRVKVSPYVFRSWFSNFDKDAVGCAKWSRYESVSTDGDPGVSEKLRAKTGSPHRIRGLWVDSPFWRGGTDIWIRNRPTSYPHVLLHNSSGKTPWHPINNGAGDADQSDATMATLGITVDSPLVPDALGNPRKRGKIAYGPINYAAPTLLSVR